MYPIWPARYSSLKPPAMIAMSFNCTLIGSRGLGCIVSVSNGKEAQRSCFNQWFCDRNLMNFSRPAYSWGCGGSCSNWSLQPSRFSAAKRGCSGGVPGWGHLWRNLRSLRRDLWSLTSLRRPQGLRPTCVEQSNFWLFVSGTLVSHVHTSAVRCY